MRTVNERLKEENLSLQTDIVAKKNEISHLLNEMKVMHALRLDLQRFERLSNTMERNREALNTKENELKDKDVKIEFLERELEVAHRAINIQSKFENSGVSFPSNREVLRSLYFELGKKQSDLHTLTLSFAEVNRALEESKKELIALQENFRQLATENENLSSNYQFVTSQSVELVKENESLNDKVVAFKEVNSNLTAQIEDFSKRLFEIRQQLQEEVEKRKEKENEVNSLLLNSDDDRKQAVDELIALQQSYAVLENSCQLKEQQSLEKFRTYQEKIRLLLEEKERLERLLKDADSARVERDILQKDIVDALRERDDVVSHRSILNENIFRLSRELQEKDSLLKERDDALEKSQRQRAQCERDKQKAAIALQRTIQVARDLSSRLQKEIKDGESARVKLLSLQQSKEAVSGMVLDALQRERKKSKETELRLRTLPLDLLIQAGLGGIISMGSTAISKSELYNSINYKNKDEGIDSFIEGDANSIEKISTSFDRDPQASQAQSVVLAETKLTSPENTDAQQLNFNREKDTNPLDLSALASVDLNGYRSWNFAVSDSDIPASIVSSSTPNSSVDCDEHPNRRISEQGDVVDELKKLRDELHRIESTGPNLSTFTFSSSSSSSFSTSSTHSFL